MNIVTAFKIGQTVFQVALESEVVWETCTACEGKGTVVLGGESLCCPKCHGNGGENVWMPHRWKVNGPFQIGQVGVRVRVPRPDQRDIDEGRWVERDGDWYEEKYMLVQTGIGSGQVYQAGRLYATDEEAQAVVDEHNRIGKDFDKRR